MRRATFGNGVVERYGYEAATGRLASIETGPGGSSTLQNLSYEWDLAGNLEQRVDQLLSRTETFNYDALDRLTSVVRNSATVFSVGYDTNHLGNIRTKTGVSGTYEYGSSRPHAVTAIGSMTFGYDLNGNMTNRNGGTIAWTSYNLPSRIERASGEYSEFLYGADRSRYRQIEGAGALQSTRHYASPGLFEVLTWNGGASRVDYHFIHANGRAVAQFTTSNVEADELTYLHRDHQGSVVATTDTAGAILDRFEYDPFGVRTTTVGSDERMHRGYTGHEHLDALDLIHMNGRVQDPLIGRFISPDPFVQAPYRSQSLNRYSYVWNNPLSLVDPSGFQTEDDTAQTPNEECNLGNLEKCTPEQRLALECMLVYCFTVYADQSEYWAQKQGEDRQRQIIRDTRDTLETMATAGTTVVANEGMGAERARESYVRNVERLASDDEVGRAAEKARARSATPPITRGVIEVVRPGLGPKPGSGGTANRASESANRMARNLGRVGRASAATGAVLGSARIATAEDKTREAVTVTGEVAGAAGGAWLLGLGGCLAGPWGCVAGGLVGGFGGGYLGGEGAQAVYDRLGPEDEQ